MLENLIEDMSTSYRVRPVPLVAGDLKDFDSFFKKALRYEREGRVGNTAQCFDQITDIVRARVICQTLEDAKRIRAMLEDLAQSGDLFIARDVEEHAGDESGYRGVHIDLSIDVQVGNTQMSTDCEVQIQTALQFAWSLYSHKDVYKGENVPQIVADLMVELSGLLHAGDRIAGRLLAEMEATHAGNHIDSPQQPPADT
jgi:ppGpp synthetase/RelA/SpoT-type nucleotidyltranferase